MAAQITGSTFSNYASKVNFQDEAEVDKLSQAIKNSLDAIATLTPGAKLSLHKFTYELVVDSNYCYTRSLAGMLPEIARRHDSHIENLRDVFKHLLKRVYELSKQKISDREISLPLYFVSRKTALENGLKVLQKTYEMEGAELKAKELHTVQECLNDLNHLEDASLFHEFMSCFYGFGHRLNPHGGLVALSKKAGLEKVVDILKKCHYEVSTNLCFSKNFPILIYLAQAKMCRQLMELEALYPSNSELDPLLHLQLGEILVTLDMNIQKENHRWNSFKPSLDETTHKLLSSALERKVAHILALCKEKSEKELTSYCQSLQDALGPQLALIEPYNKFLVWNSSSNKVEYPSLPFAHVTQEDIRKVIRPLA